MDFVDLLAAIFLTVNASKGMSMVQLSRDLDCQYKTAFVLAHKLREAIAQEVQTGEALEGHVEIDGAYFGGHIRPENAKVDRKDRRLKRHQTGKRRVVIAMREREGRVLPRMRAKASHWHKRTYRAWRPCQPTKRHTGMRCTWATT